MGGLAHQLSPEDMQTLQQARQLQQQLRSMGMGHMVEEVDNLNTPKPSKEAPKSADQPKPAAKPQKQTPKPKTVKPQEPAPVPVVETSIEPPKIETPQPQPIIKVVSNLEPQPVINYENFIEIDGLPSKGFFYPETVMGQALKVEDLLQIQTIDHTNVTQRFTEIFNRRLRGIDPLDILIMDELYISLWLRATSFPQYGFPDDGFSCKNEACDFVTDDPDYEVNFQHITFETSSNIKELSEAYADNGYVEYQLPSGRVVNIYPRVRRHEVAVDELLQHKYYRKGLIPDKTYVDMLKIATVLDIGTDSNDLDSMVEELKQFAAMDFISLIKGLNKYSPSSEAVVNHMCPKCGTVTPMKGYPFRPEIYIPIDTGR